MHRLDEKMHHLDKASLSPFSLTLFLSLFPLLTLSLTLFLYLSLSHTHTLSSSIFLFLEQVSERIAVIEKSKAKKMERRIHQATLLVHSQFFDCWSF
jgi:uncharacterized BrkB/YihY/UPF0761 family membrane protein